MSSPGLYAVVIILVAIETLAVGRVQVAVDDLGDDWDKIGELKPKDVRGYIGSNLTMKCHVRRLILEKYNLKSSDIYFRFRLLVNQKEMVIPDKYVTYPKSKKSAQIPNRASMVYPDLNITHDQAGVTCMLRVNDTHEVVVDSTIMYVGFLPAEGRVDHVVTSDLKTITITYSKSHRNPVYITKFMVRVKISSPADNTPSEYHECVQPYGEMIRNDTCRYDVSELKESNGHIDVFVRSTNLNRVTDGPVESFYLYSKYKPQPVESVFIMHSDGVEDNQSSPSVVVKWNYTSVPIPLLFNVRYSCTVDNQIQVATNMTQYYHNGPISVTLRNLHWGALYTFTITVQPNANGYISEAYEASFVTTENVPSRNPEIPPGMFDRTVKEDGSQDITVYWQPVPEVYSNGKITEFKVILITDDQSKGLSLWNRKVDDPQVTQLVVRNLRHDISYAIKVEAATEKGYNDSLPNDMLQVPQSSKVPITMATQNLTVLVSGDKSSQHVLITWANTDMPPESTNYSIVWCRRLGPESLCDPKRPLQFIMLSGALTEYELTMEDDAYRYKFGILVTTPTGSSGIQWTLCVYNRLRVAPQPGAIGDPIKGKNNLTLRLARPHCDMTGYPYGYHVLYNSTVNNHEWMTFLNTSGELYTVDKLAAATSYDIQVYSLSEAGRSRTPLRIATVKTLRMKIEIYIIPLVGLLLLMIVIAVCGLRFYRNLKKKQDVVVTDIPEDVLLRRQSPDGGQTEDDVDQDPYSHVTLSEPVVCKQTDPLIATVPNTESLSLLMLAPAMSSSNFPTMDTAFIVKNTPVLMIKDLGSCELQDDFNDDTSGMESDNSSQQEAAPEENSCYLEGGQGLEDRVEKEREMLLCAPPANHRKVMEKRASSSKNNTTDGGSINHSPKHIHRANQEPQEVQRANHATEQVQKTSPLRTHFPPPENAPLPEERNIPALHEQRVIQGLEDNQGLNAGASQSSQCPDDDSSTETMPHRVSRGRSMEDYPRIGYRTDEESTSNQVLPRAPQIRTGTQGDDPHTNTASGTRDTALTLTKLPPLQDTRLPPLQDTRLPPLQDTKLPPLQDTKLPPLQDTRLPLLQDTKLPPLQDTRLPPPQDTKLPTLQDVCQDGESPGTLKLTIEDIENSDNSSYEEDEDDLPLHPQVLGPIEESENDPYQPALSIQERLTQAEDNGVRGTVMPDPHKHELQRPESGFFSPEPSPAISINKCPVLVPEDIRKDEEDLMPDEGILSLTDADRPNSQIEDPYRSGIVQGRLHSVDSENSEDLQSEHFHGAEGDYQSTDLYQPGVIKTVPVDYDGYSRGVSMSVENPRLNQQDNLFNRHDSPYSRCEVIEGQ